MRLSSAGLNQQSPEGEMRCLNSELWHACAGPLVSLPAVGSRVVYFPQGHSEQVAASTNKKVDAQAPNYPNLPPQLICQLHNNTMHADVETDEVYAQMTLQPLSPQEKNAVSFIPSDLGCPSKQPTNYFCKTLTASDTSTHGGFSVPRRAAEKVFPPLDFTQQPPAQELIARDLHDNEWKFRHIFRGQPKRHLLTTGWSVFVSAKRLAAGDSVIFIWNEKNQLFLGIRRASRPQTVLPSSVISSDSMHLGLLAAAAHAASTYSRFTIFYNPRASPSGFVIPLAKYVKAVYHTRVSVGMRFRMLFETEESSVRRYVSVIWVMIGDITLTCSHMGTITGISDLDPARWPNSHWRSVKVGWDESAAGEKQPRVSLWEIEPLTTFNMYRSPFPLRLKRPWPPGLSSFSELGMRNEDMGIAMNSPLMWVNGDDGYRNPSYLDLQGIGVAPCMQPSPTTLSIQNDLYQAMAAAAFQEMRNANPSKQALSSFMQFQQIQDMANRPGSLMQPQISQQLHSQPPFVQSLPDSLPKSEPQLLSQTLSLQKQLQSPNSLQPQLQHPPELQHKLDDLQQFSTVMPVLSEFASSSQSQSPLVQSFPSTQQQSYSNSNGDSISKFSEFPLYGGFGSVLQDGISHLVNVPRSSTSLSPNGRPPKRVAVDPLLPNVLSHAVSSPIGRVGHLNANLYPNSVSLPPFPGKECFINQGSNDIQNNILFGVNMDPSSHLMQNGMPNLSNHADSTAMPYGSSTFGWTTDNGIQHNSTSIASRCADEPGLMPMSSTEDIGQENSPSGTFVKVYKSGSYGRSLDISKFSSYHELRMELARMFGLIEGLLEDPLRSGWQLIFVDRENDVLLLGDDPWLEFVKNVWCIKILSPQEVQHMSNQDPQLLNAAAAHVSRTRNSSSYDEYASQHELRNPNARITSTGSINY